MALFVKLTEVNSSQCLAINPDNVQAVRTIEYHREQVTVITRVDGKEHTVTEPHERVLTLLAGGR